MLSEILRKENYQTAGFVSLAVLRRAFGLSRGFQKFDDDFVLHHRPYRVASEMNAVAIPWIKEHRNQPFFAWIHYSDPHEPYITVNAQPDTELRINGSPVARICLAKQEDNTVKFIAMPGETKIDFYGLTGRANIRIYMDRLIWSPAGNGIKVGFGKEWTQYAHGAGGSGRSFDQGHGSLTVKNSNRQPVSMTLTFEGRLYPSIKKIQENYEAEVQYVDRHVGMLWNKLQELGLLDNTIVVLTADHGESLGEHSRVGHLFPLWSQIIDVPLIIYYPRLGFKGKKVEQIVDHLDIAPTILDLLRRRVPASMEGESLKRYMSWSPVDLLLAKRKHRPRALAYTFAPQGRANMYSVIEGPMKLIQQRAGGQWKWQSYNLQHDPGEAKDLFAQDPSRWNHPPASLMRSILVSYSHEAETAFSKRLGHALSEEDKEMLRSLGYVSP